MDGKKLTDRFYPVLLRSEVDNSPVEGVVFGDVTAHFSFEGAVGTSGLQLLTILTADWKEPFTPADIKKGLYWLQMGLTEWASIGTHQVIVEVPGATRYIFFVEVTALTPDESAFTAADRLVLNAIFTHTSLIPLTSGPLLTKAEFIDIGYEKLITGLTVDNTKIVVYKIGTGTNQKTVTVTRNNEGVTISEVVT